MSVSKSAPAVELAEEVLAPAPAPAPEPGEKARKSMLNLMRDKFSKEKRVPVKLRNDGDVFVQVNGYSFLIKPNVRVEVPESIVVLLEDGGYI